MIGYDGVCETDINVPWNCDYVKLWVSQINFTANFLITTEDDFIIIEFYNKDDILTDSVKVGFPNKSDYEIDSLTAFLDDLVNTEVGEESLKVKFSMKNNRLLLELYNGFKVRISDASHRAKLLIGLTNTSANVPNSKSFQLPLSIGTETIKNQTKSHTTGFLLDTTGQKHVAPNPAIEDPNLKKSDLALFLKVIHSIPGALRTSSTEILE
jgi:hypothetical protein